MLGTIRESPVSSLNTELSPEALTAKNILDEVTKDVLRMGWAFNLERDVELEPDGSDNITLASTVMWIEVDRSTITSTHDPVCRGPTLFNRGTNTYTFDTTVKCTELCRDLDWDLIPETARRYIALRASRIFSNRVNGSQKLEQDASIEEGRALRELRRDHGRAERPNMLLSPGVVDLAFRDRNYSWLQ